MIGYALGGVVVVLALAYGVVARAQAEAERYLADEWDGAPA